MADANEFLELAEGGYIMQIQAVLQAITADKALFASVPVNTVPLILADLQSYQTTNGEYLASLMTGTPVGIFLCGLCLESVKIEGYSIFQAPLLATVEGISQRISAQFSTAVAAYSSSSSNSS
jgi:hypothetical protein